MVDLPLMRAILRALPEEAALCPGRRRRSAAIGRTEASTWGRSSPRRRLGCAPDRPRASCRAAVDRRPRKVGGDGAPDPRPATGQGRHKTIDWRRPGKFWAFQPPQRTPCPPSRTPPGPHRHRPLPPGQLESEGTAAGSRTPTASTLLRRAYFDLIGLPPTPEEIDAFVNDHVARRLREGGRSTARLAALRRALGPALARRGPLRRVQPAAAARCSSRTPGATAITSSTPSTPTCRYDRFITRADRRRPAARRDAGSSAEQLIATAFLVLGPDELRGAGQAACSRWT